MEDSIYESLKKRIDELSPLSPLEWNDFARKWKRKSVVKGEYLLKAGQVEKYFYYVHYGVLRMFGENKEEEVDVGFSYDGEYSGIYDSFLAQKPTDMYLQAITACEMLRISHEDLMEQFDKYKSVERWGRIFNANMLIRMARRQVETRAYNAEEKFKRLAQNSPHILEIVPHKYLASYLGMTPETFSRLRSKLK